MDIPKVNTEATRAAIINANFPIMMPLMSTRILSDRPSIPSSIMGEGPEWIRDYYIALGELNAIAPGWPV